VLTPRVVILSEAKNPRILLLRAVRTGQLLD
jgi:hypothetical protein